MYTLIRLAAVLQLQLSELVAGLAVEQLPPVRGAYTAVDKQHTPPAAASPRYTRDQAAGFAP